VEVPNSVTYIGSSAFEGCTGLINVSIGSGVTFIDQAAFRYCNSLTSITIDAATPPSLTSSALDSTNECPIFVPCRSVDAYKSAWSAYADRIQCVSGKYYAEYISGSTYNPSCDGHNIGRGSIYNNTQLLKIYIGKCVTELSDYAFISATYYDSAWYLGTILLHNAITRIGDCAFDECQRLTSIVIPNSVTSIGSYAFNYCYALSSVTISNYVSSIGDCAFYRCHSLTSINIPYGVTSIGNQTFFMCAKLSYISLPDGITSIGNGAFSGCSMLPSIEIPSGVTSMGNGAFKECSSLTSINIPYTVTSFGETAFNNCTSLPVTENIRYADTYAVGAVSRGLTAYILKNDTRFIGYSSFSGCTNLAFITIPNSVITIERFAFFQCTSLTSVTIPAYVMTIKGSAFYHCSSLQSVTCLAATPPAIDSSAFEDTNNCPIYVPAASVETYKATDGWYAYRSRIQAIP
jgi:hypothetical protein